MNPAQLRERALGAYLGLAVGDALGATVEFMTPYEIEQKHGMHKSMLGGGWLKLKPGQVTDDTEMALALGQAITSVGHFELQAVAEAFVRWLRSRPVDVGNTCRRGISRYIRDGSLSTPLHDGDAGNGACMRNLPVALATLGNEQAFIEATLAQCHFTHNHPLSDAATIAMGQMVQQLLLGGDIRMCRELANRLIVDQPVFRFDPYPKRASAYIVDTLQTVLYFFFRTDCYEDCLISIVNRGEDADTTGALAGMLAGAAYGWAGIPARWLSKLDVNVRQEIETQTADLLDLALPNLPALRCE